MKQVPITPMLVGMVTAYTIIGGFSLWYAQVYVVPLALAFAGGYLGTKGFVYFFYGEKPQDPMGFLIQKLL
jgi:hypothetical protein